MNVLVVEPGYLPYEKEINGLEEMQATVGGYIQVIYPYEEPVAIVCNEEESSKGWTLTAASPEAMAAFSAPSSFAVWERKTFVRFPRSWSTVSRRSTRKRKS